jgi:AcrR family transcriptional regulator
MTSSTSPKGQSTRTTIIDEALSQASRIGLEALSIGGLAKDVGMSKSGLFAHFDSKEDLQLQVLESSVERFVEHIIAPSLTEPRGVPRIRAFFDNWLSWEHTLAGGCIFMQLANELDDRPGPLREKLVAYQRDWIEALSTAADIAVAEGHFRGDLDRQQFAYDIYSIMLAYHHFHRLLRDPGAERRARRAFEDLLDACSPPGH